MGDEKGRWNTHEFNENYPGFPNGILAKDLRNLMLKQAVNFGARFQQDEIIIVKKDLNYSSKKNSPTVYFTISSDKKTYQAKTIILATGVEDKFPKFPNWQEYVGKSLFWCITCDGFKTNSKRVLVVGQNDEAMCDCLQFKDFTNKLVFVSNAIKGKSKFSESWKKHLQQASVPFYDEEIVKVIGNDGVFEKVILTSGKEIAFDYLFSEQGMEPKNKLAKMLNLSLSHDGYIEVDLEQRTNIKNVYAAGDVTKPFDQQITSAVHEGSTAAEAANYDLYKPWQKM